MNQSRPPGQRISVIGTAPLPRNRIPKKNNFVRKTWRPYANVDCCPFRGCGKASSRTDVCSAQAHHKTPTYDHALWMGRHPRVLSGRTGSHVPSGAKTRTLSVFERTACRAARTTSSGDATAQRRTLSWFAPSNVAMRFVCRARRPRVPCRS